MRWLETILPADAAAVAGAAVRVDAANDQGAL